MATRGCTLIFDKPITPAEFDRLTTCDYLKEADRLIKALNRRVENRELVLQWGGSPEADEVIATVDAHYKEFGWAGVTQHMVTSNNTRIMTEDEMREGSITGKVIITVLRKDGEER